jgi:hypothetical protein
MRPLKRKALEEKLEKQAENKVRPDDLLTAWTMEYYFMEFIFAAEKAANQEISPIERRTFSSEAA